MPIDPRVPDDPSAYVSKLEPGALTREICGLCHRVSPVGFHVPDDVWRLAVHPSRINDVHCLSCFIERADEKLLRWDLKIKFYPVSFATHLELCDSGVTVGELRRAEREAKMREVPRGE